MRVPDAHTCPLCRLPNLALQVHGYDARKMCSQCASDGTDDSLLQICVIEDKYRALSSRFEHDALQVRPRSGLHDLSPYRHGAIERDLTYLHVLGQGLSSNVTVAREDTEGASWKASLVNEFGHFQHRQRGVLRRLEDHGIPCGQCRSDLEHAQEHCERMSVSRAS